MAAESGGSGPDQGELFSLQEFTDCYDLPQWVEVVGGRDAGPAHPGTDGLQKGMIVMLRTLAVDNVTLSFNDAETGSKRIAKVSPNSQVRFKILLPFPDYKNPKEKRTVYNTVADLLSVCPTYFKSNVFYDDPYLPAIVKSGEVFRFIREIKGRKDRRRYLQCEDGEGNVVELPAECRGDFTAIEDDKSYNLQEILELGTVDRKLKLSHEHIKISGDTPKDAHTYSNVTSGDSSSELQRIMGLPLTYSGMLTFHCPEMFLVASPSDNIQDMWKVPRDMDVQVRQYQVEEYDRPVSGGGGASVGHGGSSHVAVCKMFKLSELLDTFHEEFPVRATLVHYKEMPEEFARCLEPGCDVVIHGIERYERLLAKSGDMNFVISRDMTGRFRKTLRKLYCIEDLRLIHSDGEEVMVKVLQDVASDFPIPFSLQTGEVLRFKTLQTKMHKIKRKSKSFGQFPVVQCERKLEGYGHEKLLIPEDLEICMHELPSRAKMDGFSAEDVFRFKPELPFKVDYLADYTTLWSCLPICSEITLTNFITEALALVSVVPNSDQSKHIEPRIPDVLLVPARHHVMLTVKECLGFPPSYFVFPDRRTYISVPVEKLSRSAQDDLVRHNDMAYEDYEPDSPQSTPGNILLPARAKNGSVSSDDLSFNKRLSRSLSNLFNSKANSVKVGVMKKPNQAGKMAKNGSISSDDLSVNKRLSRSLSNLFNSKAKGFKAGIMKKLKKTKSSSDKKTSPNSSTFAVDNTFYGTQASSSDAGDDHYDDDNIYESVNVSGHR